MYMILERLKVDNLLTASIIALENLSHNRKYCGSQKSKYITDKSIRLNLNSINGSIDVYRSSKVYLNLLLLIFKNEIQKENKTKLMILHNDTVVKLN